MVNLPLSRWKTLSAALSLSLCLSSPSAATNKLPSAVKDLHYGEVLFHFYQDDFLNTITRLKVAQKQNLLKYHDDEAKIMEASLYLSYGMHRHAQTIFRQLLDQQEISATVRNKVWFYLAKMAYQKNDSKGAQEALGHIDEALPGDLEAERLLLNAQVLIQQERYPAAAELLSTWPHTLTLAPYAHMNRAVALIRNDQIDEGIRTLQIVATMNVESDNKELLALKDKANLNIGFTLLRQDDFDAARAHLEQVRLEGPFANKALLGAGWALTKQEQYDKAALYWQVLSKRDSSQAAVQEAMLGMSYAYRKIGALGAAAQQYEITLEQLDTEQKRLAETTQTIKNGSMLDALKKLNPSQTIGNLWQLNGLANRDESRYLANLMASNAFREGLKNYLDLRDIKTTLIQLRNSAEAFEDILQTRQQDYQQQVEKINKQLSNIDTDELRLQVNYLKQHHDAVTSTEYALALATKQERQWWNRLQNIQKKLRTLPYDEKYNELRQKYRLLKGVTVWQMESNLAPKLWQAKKGIKELDEALEAVYFSRYAADEAIIKAKQGFEGYDQRIAQQRQQVATLQGHMSELTEQQARHLEGLALTFLAQQKNILEKYVARAQFALAQIYDQASADAEKNEVDTPHDDP